MSHLGTVIRYGERWLRAIGGISVTPLLAQETHGLMEIHTLAYIYVVKMTSSERNKTNLESLAVRFGRAHPVDDESMHSAVDASVPALFDDYLDCPIVLKQNIRIANVPTEQLMRINTIADFLLTFKLTVVS